MNQEDIEELINQKIKEHELRVGISSSIIGGLIVMGMFHAIWLLRIDFFQ